MTKLLKFYCPKCRGEKLEVVQTDAVLSQHVQVNAEDGAVYYTDTPEILDSCIDRWQCVKCGYVIPCGNDEESLADWLREQPYNHIERTPDEQQEIADAVDGVLAAQMAYDNARAKLDLSLWDRYTVGEHLALLRAYKVLYMAIGGCDELIKQVEAREEDVVQNQ